MLRQSRTYGYEKLGPDEKSRLFFHNPIQPAPPVLRSTGKHAEGRGANHPIKQDNELCRISLASGVPFADCLLLG